MVDGRFEALVNFRDLGGYPVGARARLRPGRLYRSDSLAHASPADVRRLLGDLNLATVVDLRGAAECARRGWGPMVEKPVTYVSVPISDVSLSFAEAASGGSLADHYVTMLDERGTALAAVVRRLADAAALPAVVHCEAGCDRTGVVIAALLGLLGASDEVIISDYELTRDALPAMNARWRRLYPDADDEIWSIRVNAMDRTIAAVRARWGGWFGWASAFGLGPDDVSRLRSALVDPEPADQGVAS